ncbi:hypothetical protein H0X09_03600 [Candidatus Saccharibacteria bacterium]|nr:hypothetical protein [Candidatus Saccharibacteria bacterium]
MSDRYPNFESHHLSDLYLETQTDRVKNLVSNADTIIIHTTHEAYIKELAQSFNLPEDAAESLRNDFFRQRAEILRRLDASEERVDFSEPLPVDQLSAFSTMLPEYTISDVAFLSDADAVAEVREWMAAEQSDIEGEQGV